jgi:hypothetical protein
MNFILASFGSTIRSGWCDAEWMQKTLGPVLLLLFSTLLYGQLDSNSITVTASRTVTLAPDEVVFRVNAAGPANTTMTDAVAALSSLGITAANFAGVNSNPSALFAIITSPAPGLTPVFAPPAPAPVIEWSFYLVAPITQMKDTIVALNALQQKAAANPIVVSFQLNGTQISTRLSKAQTCSTVDLIADARAKAQKIADPAGLNVGTVLAMWSSTATQIANNVVVINTYNTTGPDCSVTVKFALGRYVQ